VIPEVLLLAILGMYGANWAGVSPWTWLRDFPSGLLVKFRMLSLQALKASAFAKSKVWVFLSERLLLLGANLLKLMEIAIGESARAGIFPLFWWSSVSATVLSWRHSSGRCVNERDCWVTSIRWSRPSRRSLWI
jgi:hypothetical protein